MLLEGEALNLIPVVVCFEDIVIVASPKRIAFDCVFGGGKFGDLLCQVSLCFV